MVVQWYDGTVVWWYSGMVVQWYMVVQGYCGIVVWLVTRYFVEKGVELTTADYVIVQSLIEIITSVSC